MIALIQRVSRAQVSVGELTVGAIDRGILALIGIRPEDTEASGVRLLQRVLNYRVFDDDAGRMNRSLREVGGDLLLVPQFTLAADTRGGTRPGFSTAAEPKLAHRLYEQLLAQAREQWPHTASGVFGASMRVSLENDGPVTFWLES